jgi:hypothetical protein
MLNANRFLILLASFFLHHEALAARVVPEAPTERARITLLMENVANAGLDLSQRALTDSHLEPDDKRDAQTQLARILIVNGRCNAAWAFLKVRTEVLASGIDRSIYEALKIGDRTCATQLAAIMAARWDDPYYVPRGRIGLKYTAGAYLRAGGDASGLPIMKESETKLRGMGAVETLWDVRFHSITAYRDTPLWNSALEDFTARLETEHDSPDSYRRGAASLFAAYDRCDLFDRIMKAGPNACEKEKPLSVYFYQPDTHKCAAVKRPQDPDELETFGTIDEAGLMKAMKQPTLFGKMANLLFLEGRLRMKLECLPK